MISLGRSSTTAALAVALTALIGSGSASPAAAGPPAVPAPPPAARYTPFDPTKEPAFRGEQDLKEGAERLRSGISPLPNVVRQISPGLFQLGTITLDLRSRRATVPGRISLANGIVEYLAVMEGRGKTYESVLALDVQPSLFQLALILLGLETSEWAPPEAGVPKPPTVTKPGDPVLLWVEWDRAGKTERIPADRLIFNRETHRSLEGNEWRFTGSFFTSRGFAADITGSIIATWFDFRAILNASAQAQNPYRGLNVGYEVNAAVTPPMNTPIRLVLEPAAPRPDDGR